MEQKLRMFLTLCMAVLFSATAWAQERTITGRVTEGSGEGAIGVNVIVKGTTTGAATDFDGNYTISNVAEDAKILVFSGIGYASQEVEIGNQSKIDVTIAADVQQLSEVVVTALGISREKQSLGYAVQEVSGAEMNEVPQTNMASSLSGRVAGVQIKSSSNMGGSTNVVIRGINSLSGGNQALFVVDGVPIANNNDTGANQLEGHGGYDYGNAAQDINPEDIETVSVLKGASAAALYGSRAANGVILITTKKGTKRKGIGVSLSAGWTFDKINKNTLPKYQYQYGGGYYSSFDKANLEDAEGNVKEFNVAAYYADESWGPKLDGTLVRQWDSFDPKDVENYGKARPWLAPSKKLEDFFETGVTSNYSVSLNGGDDKGSFRASYSNISQKGWMPNSKLDRNTLSFNGSVSLTDKLSASSSMSYINTAAKARPGTGYDERNVMSSLGSWTQTQLDFGRLKNNYQTAGGQQKTWNRKGASNGRANYWDNPYWTQKVNYNEDERNRFFGNTALDYKVTDWLTLTGKAGLDYYSEIREDYIEVTSLNTPYFGKIQRNRSERNLDLMATFNKKFNDDWSVNGLVGVNQRINKLVQTSYGTVGGLSKPDWRAISNSSSAEINPGERYEEAENQSVYGNVSVGYRNMVYVDLTARNDWSSTLPTDNNSFFYPSVSASFVFSELIESNILSFGKIRGNWARVGNAASIYSVNDTYFSNPNFGSNPNLTVSTTRNNADLKNETKESVEFGIETYFLQRRLGLDVTYFNDSQKDLIMRLPLSPATGYFDMWVNAGEITNSGWEVSLKSTPLILGDFQWNLDINWSKYENEVKELANGAQTYLIASPQGGSIIQARVGEAYGTIRGVGYEMHEGRRVIGANGTPVQSDLKTLGNITPDWNAGISNRFSYKGITLSALVDIQKGGDIYSLSSYYAEKTGVLEHTAIGREAGVVFDGVNVKKDENGNVTEVIENNTVINGQSAYANNTWGLLEPHVYDATYVKLREISLTYSLPKKIIGKTPFSNVSLSLIGRNLAILYKNTYFDPEVTNGAGNIQGIESNSLPSTKSYGFKISLGL